VYSDLVVSRSSRIEALECMRQGNCHVRLEAFSRGIASGSPLTAGMEADYGWHLQRGKEKVDSQRAGTYTGPDRRSRAAPALSSPVQRATGTKTASLLGAGLPPPNERVAVAAVVMFVHQARPAEHATQRLQTHATPRERSARST